MRKADKNMPVVHSSVFTVPFFDVDSMFIVWHGHYVKYLEVARCEFLGAVGYDYDVMRSEGFGWPVIKLELKYVRPAVFGQKIRVDIRLVEYETYLKLDYLICDEQTGMRLTEASTTQAAVSLDGNELQYQTPAGWQHAVQHFLQNTCRVPSAGKQ